MVRIDPAAEDSFADILARMKFGIAIAAMIKMIATTISNSIREKPFCFLMNSPWEHEYRARAHRRLRNVRVKPGVLTVVDLPLTATDNRSVRHGRFVSRRITPPPISPRSRLEKQGIQTVSLRQIAPIPTSPMASRVRVLGSGVAIAP